MLNTSNILTQSSNRGIFRIKLNEPDTYNALSFKTISFLIGILKKLNEDNVSINGLPIKATYDSPFTLPLLRRNEAMFNVEWKKN